jgi:hypothetical protein
MAYRTNRRTGGTFRTDDITGGRYQGRFSCPICASMFGPDVSPEEAELRAKMVGREIPGTNLSTFPTRAELNQHMKMIHQSGQRLPTKQHRQLGRIPPKEQVSETVGTSEGITSEGPQTASDEGGLLGTAEDDEEMVGDVDSSEDILGKEEDKQDIFSGGEDEDDGAFI